MLAVNLYATLAETFRSRASASALVTPDGETLSYAELDQLAARCAAALAELGLEAGDRLFAQVDKSVGAVGLYLGCLRLGAVYLPANTGYTDEEVRYLIGDAEPTIVVARPERLESLAAAAPGAATLSQQEFDARAAATAPVDGIHEVAADDLAALVYTSGTTGQPKGAMTTHANLTTNARALRHAWALSKDDILLHALPLFHVHGLFVSLNTALLAGCTIRLHARFDAESVVQDLANSTVMMGVPTFYTRMLKAGVSAEQCSKMRLFVSGSAPLLPQTFAAFEAATGHRVLERYGMSEAGIIASNPFLGDRVPGTVGHPLPGVELRVVDESRVPVPANAVGELEIRGPNVCRGYWGKGATRELGFQEDGYFATGDLAAIDEEGRLTIVGRGKDLIISGGYNVYPKEVESVIDVVPGIVESAVIGVPHPDFGEAVVAVVVTDQACALESLGEAVETRLASYKRPKQVERVPALPRNAMGKVQKNRLRERFASLFD